MFSGSMGVADFQCRQILSKDQYQRIDAFFDRRINLDSTDPASLAYLEATAKAVNLNPVVKWLTANKW